MRKFKLGALVLGTALALGVGAGIALNAKEAVGAKADEGDNHDFAQTTSVILNNSAAIDAIEIADQGYAIAGVEVTWNYNKNMNAVDAVVTVGGDTVGEFNVATKTTKTESFECANLTGAVVISFTNKLTASSGCGTFKVSNVRLIEGSSGPAKTLEGITVGGAMSKTSYTTSESWDPTGLTVTALYDDSSEKDVTSKVSWSYNPATPAEGVTSVVATATYEGEDDSITVQPITVTVAHAGTESDPFTVSEALAKCTEIGAVGNTGQGPWVTKGIISRVTSAPAATYWNCTYYISDDGTQNNELQVYRGFYLNNAKFDATTALLMKSGMIVTITGNLTGSYGSEYCQGNYLLAIEEPDTGDVDVTFEPAVTSFEIGASGTFTASSETQGVTYSWAVDNSSVLTVNSSTGAYEAKGLGVARVTVTATANNKEGYAFADITVNGNSIIGVSDANTIAAGVASGQTTAYYVYVEGYVKEFGTSKDKSDNPRAFDIMDLEGNSIMVYTNVNPYADFINGLALGDYIEVKGNIQNYSGKYEITNPVKVASNTSAVSLAFEILSETDGQCASFVDKESDYDEFKAFFEQKWTALGTKFDALTDGNILVTADAKEDGTVVEQAMARYDFLTAKYQLDNFVTGRSVASINVPVTYSVETNNNIALIVIAAVALVSVASVVTIIVIKRKSLNR